MANIDFNALAGSLKNEVSALALSSVQNYTNQAKADGLKLLESMEADIKKWAEMLADGKMSKEDVEFLVQAKKDLVVMNGLKQAGLGQIRIDAFKNSVLNLIVKTVVGLV